MEKNENLYGVLYDLHDIDDQLERHRERRSQIDASICALEEKRAAACREGCEMLAASGTPAAYFKGPAESVWELEDGVFSRLPVESALFIEAKPKAAAPELAPAVTAPDLSRFGGRLAWNPILSREPLVGPGLTRVSEVVKAIHDGLTFEQTRRSFPGITAEDIFACLDYAGEQDHIAANTATAAEPTLATLREAL